MPLNILVLARIAACSARCGAIPTHACPDVNLWSLYVCWSRLKASQKRKIKMPFGRSAGLTMWQMPRASGGGATEVEKIFQPVSSQVI